MAWRSPKLRPATARERVMVGGLALASATVFFFVGLPWHAASLLILASGFFVSAYRSRAPR